MRSGLDFASMMALNCRINKNKKIACFAGSALAILLFFIYHHIDAVSEEIDYEAARQKMVEEQLIARGIKDKKVLEIMGLVERHKFVPEDMKKYAYEDTPLPIGEGQTISQPYIVALMTELLKLKGDEVILEIGTGSGYQAAILAELAKEVYTIEIIDSLGRQAQERLEGLGYTNIKVRIADGYYGWQEYAPFDGIIVTAAADYIPQPLVDQLKIGGRLIIPVGDKNMQKLLLVQKELGGKLKKYELTAVMFVPLVGEHPKEKTAEEQKVKSKEVPPENKKWLPVENKKWKKKKP